MIIFKDPVGNYLVSKHIKSRGIAQIAGYNNQGKLLDSKSVSNLMNKANIKVHTKFSNRSGIHQDILVTLPPKSIMTDAFSKNLKFGTPVVPESTERIRLMWAKQQAPEPKTIMQPPHDDDVLRFINYRE